MSEKTMTTEDLKRIAEACGYEVVKLYEGLDINCGVYRVVGPQGETIGHIGGTQRPFAPHLDFNQAVACLGARFGHNWSIEPRADGYYTCWYRTSAEVEFAGERAISFCAAACAAILASLEAADDE